MAYVHSIHATRASDLDCYRYAIYWSPTASSPLSELASRWLGRDAQTGATFDLPSIAGLSQRDVHNVVRRPAHYGLHATLKSPFRLDNGVSARRLLDRVAAFAEAQRGFMLPVFELVYRNGFFYLQPSDHCGPVNALADACVTDFDDLRAPLNDADIARRRIHELTDSEREYVYQWGYPRVFDAYNMHLTLTSRIDDTLVKQVRTALESLSHLWREPSKIDAVTVFAQQTADDDFRLIKRFAFSDAGDE